MKHGIIRSPSISSAAVRQTVLSGSQDANGFPNALSIGAGLSVTLTASTVTPFLVSFADGFDSNGAIDYVGRFTTQQTLTLPPNSPPLLVVYVERNPTTGVLTLGSSAPGVGFTYGFTTPLNPSVGQHWFNLSTFKMSIWNGSAWVAVQRVLIGEAVTNATNTTAVVNYAYKGFYASNWVPVVANTLYVFNHNLGVQLASGADLTVYSSNVANDGDAIVASSALVSGASSYGYQRFNGALQVWKSAQIRSTDFPLLDTLNNWATTGFYKVIARRLF